LPLKQTTQFVTDSLVLIPTFNEKENIAAIIEAVFALPEPFAVLVIDDGSPDGTALIVKELQNKFSQLYILERTEKSGLGRAYIAGFEWALARDFQYIFEMDADFSHPPKSLISLKNKAKTDADLVIGSRYVQGGEVVNWPLDRKFYSMGGSIYAQMILWWGVKDPTAGFICYRRAVLEAIDFGKIKFVGYAFQIEMKWAAKTLGFRLAEVPIIFKDRELGTSKMSLKIVREGIIGVIQMRFRSLFGNYGR
jgi:dolichol-phosphate mannosyltransferase